MAVKITQNGIDTVQDNIISASSIVNYGVSADDLPSGVLLQTKFANSNSNVASYSISTPIHFSWVDITLTTMSDNSTFIVQGQYSCDDTNSNDFGCGIGTYVTGATITDEYWIYPAAHEDYTSGGADTYFVASHATGFAPGYPKGTTFTIRMYGRFNNSNGRTWTGNGTPYYCFQHIVQEFKG